MDTNICTLCKYFMRKYMKNQIFIEKFCRNFINKGNFFICGIALLFLFLSLFSWNLEPTVSRDGLLYLELVQIWHDHGSFQAVLEYWPQFWIPPFPLYLMKLLTDCGIPAEAGGGRVNIPEGTYRHGVLSAADRLRDRHGDHRETEHRTLFSVVDGSESLHDRAGD